MPFRKKQEKLSPGKNLLGNIRERLSIVEDRLDEIASLLEYEFLTKDDPERLAIVEERLEHRLREEKRRAELEKLQREKEEQEKIEKAAADLLKAQEEEMPSHEVARFAVESSRPCVTFARILGQSDAMSAKPSVMRIRRPRMLPSWWK